MNKGSGYSLALALLLLLVLPSFSFAQQDTAPMLSGEDVAEAKRIALADKRVQSYIEGKSYSLMSYGVSTNENIEPRVWYVTLLYNIDNKDQMTVTVDLQKDAVIDIQYLADFMPQFYAPVETTEPTIVTLLSSFLPILVAFAVAVAAIIVIFLVGKRTKQSAMNHP